jgi:uncharacterized short protein YbdD (DUF466 family)
MRLARILARLAETARLMVGLPRYDAYRQHMAACHPDEAVMSEVEFFRDRQEARYGGRSGGRCC